MLGLRLNNFEIVRLLGAGGMGTVYEARHLFLRRKVAVKVLRAELVGSSELVQRFLNEARATSAIRHPNIIEVLDVGELSDGVPYLVMELLEGESLADRLSRVKRLEIDAALELACQAASALDAAHDKGIVHRDLKPDNLFLVPDARVAGGERVKVLDFGIAKLRADLSLGSVDTIAGTLYGSPPYMSPEQCRGVPAQIDHRADIYSLGIILYEMLCGERPFVAEGMGDLLLMHMSAEPVPPSQLCPELAPEIDAAILRALAKAREQRFETMAEFAAALGAGEQYVVVQAPPATVWAQPSERKLAGDAGVGARDSEPVTRIWRPRAAEPPEPDTLVGAWHPLDPYPGAADRKRGAQTVPEDCSQIQVRVRRPEGGEQGAATGSAPATAASEPGAARPQGPRRRLGGARDWTVLAVVAAGLGLFAGLVSIEMRWADRRVSRPATGPGQAAAPAVVATAADSTSSPGGAVRAPAGATSARGDLPAPQSLSVESEAAAPAWSEAESAATAARQASRASAASAGEAPAPTPSPGRRSSATSAPEPPDRGPSTAAATAVRAREPSTAAVPATPERETSTVASAADAGGASPEVEPGYLSLDSAPWSDVFLGGRLLGTTPLLRVPLPPGHHLLTLKNPELGASTSYAVEIKSGMTVARLVGWK